MRIDGQCLQFPDGCSLGDCPLIAQIVATIPLAIFVRRHVVSDPTTLSESQIMFRCTHLPIGLLLLLLPIGSASCFAADDTWPPLKNRAFCVEATNGCQVCTFGLLGRLIGCSLPGIACQPDKKWKCTKARFGSNGSGSSRRSLMATGTARRRIRSTRLCQAATNPIYQRSGIPGDGPGAGTKG